MEQTVFKFKKGDEVKIIAHGLHHYGQKAVIRDVKVKMAKPYQLRFRDMNFRPCYYSEDQLALWIEKAQPNG